MSNSLPQTSSQGRYTQITDVGRFVTDSNDPLLGEVILKKALKHAQEYYGRKSPIVGLILMDLRDFYQAQGRTNEYHQTCTRLGMLMANQICPNEANKFVGTRNARAKTRAPLATPRHSVGNGHNVLRLHRATNSKRDCEHP